MNEVNESKEVRVWCDGWYLILNFLVPISIFPEERDNYSYHLNAIAPFY